jgi:hypothetical protein
VQLSIRWAVWAVEIRAELTSAQMGQEAAGLGPHRTIFQRMC